MTYPDSRFSLFVARINSLVHKARNRISSPLQGSIINGIFNSRGKLRGSLALNSAYIRVFGWTCGMIIFLLPVFKAWHTGASYQTLFGILPNTDGPHYFTGAMQLLHNGQIIDWATIRPINSAFLAVRIAACGGNVQGAILLQALFLGLCCSLAARVIFRDLGSLSGIAFFLLLFQFGIWSASNLCTEALGLSLGALAFSILWPAARTGYKWSFFFGMLILTLALETRAGAFLILPCLVVFASFAFASENKKWSWRAMGITSAAIMLGLILQIGITKLYCGNIRIGQDNFGYLVYNMAKGKDGWRLGFEEGIPMEELYSKAWQEIKKNPSNLFLGAYRRFVGFLDETRKVLEIRTIDPVGPPRTPRKRPESFEWIDVLGTILLLYATIVVLCRDYRLRQMQMVLFAFTGYLLSGPILGSVAFRRIFVTTAPFLMAFHSIGFSITKGNRIAVKEDKTKCPSANRHSGFSLFLGVSFIIVLLFGPYLSHLAERNVFNVPLVATQEGNTNTLIVRIDPGMPHIVVFDNELNEPTFIPRIRQSDYDRIRSMGWEKRRGFGEIDCSGSINTIVMTYFNSESQKQDPIFIVGPEKMLRIRSQHVKLYGRRWFNLGRYFFIAERVEPFRMKN